MTFEEKVDTCDVLMVEDRTTIGRLIRGLTGQQVNHIAMVEKGPKTTWVIEMTMKDNFSATPLKRWLQRQDRTKAYLYWGKAPQPIRGGCAGLTEQLFDLRRNPPQYSLWTLITVWWAQITRKHVAHKYVCSTLVHVAWEACGYEFDQTPDPGDFMRHCVSVAEIEESDLWT